MKSNILDSKQKYYLCSYQYQGEQWCFRIPAHSQEDAEARLKAIPYGKIDGEIPAVILVPNTFLEKLKRWAEGKLKL